MQKLRQMKPPGSICVQDHMIKDGLHVINPSDDMDTVYVRSSANATVRYKPRLSRVWRSSQSGLKRS